MNGSRNIVIITGRNVVGKTLASNYLRDWCFLQRIPCEQKAISDAQSLFKAMQLDDEMGGFHHTHDWCKAREYKEYNEGHLHEPTQSMLPFKVIGNKLPDDMLFDFFTELTRIPGTKQLYFVEWAAGSNMNPMGLSAHEVDYSCSKVKRMLQDGSLPSSWLTQVHSVIRIIASNEKRFTFNEMRHIPTLAEIEYGTASWATDNEVLQFYGKDDFIEIEEIFRNRDIPVHSIVNNESASSFEKKLHDLAYELFRSHEVQSKDWILVR